MDVINRTFHGERADGVGRLVIGTTVIADK